MAKIRIVESQGNIRITFPASEHYNLYNAGRAAITLIVYERTMEDVEIIKEEGFHDLPMVRKGGA